MFTVVALMTWCYAADLNSHGACVYDREQCLEIVRLRRAGICYPAGIYPRAL